MKTYVKQTSLSVILFLIMLQFSKKAGYIELFFFQVYVTPSKIAKSLGNGCELNVDEVVNVEFSS